MSVTVSGTIKHVTDKAILIEEYGEWIPISQIIEADFDLDELEKGQRIDMEIPNWLAREKGLE